MLCDVSYLISTENWATAPHWTTPTNQWLAEYHHDNAVTPPLKIPLKIRATWPEETRLVLLA